ncbi:MAG: hydroxymethylglutaryl-CoA synthase, partial [Frankiaceae bacterium]|nr:hydroxymethylglutaryl-CoA synthase [Frankiaceae bacterium]
MRGILGWGAYVPRRRLDRTSIAAVAGAGGGTGTRAAAGYDEDSTTLAVEAARTAVRGSAVLPRALWFATTTPTYADKTNATAVHAALRLDRSLPAYDALGSVRSTVGALRAGLDSAGPALVVASDVRVGRPGGSEESAGGDGAGAVLVGDEAAGPVLAELVGQAGLTEEFLDRWRVPGDASSRTWEERFGETKYAPLAAEALKAALGDSGLDVGAVDVLVVAGLHERACAAAAKKSGIAAANTLDRLTSSIGNAGAAQPLLLLASALEGAQPGQVVVLLVLSDGADAFVFRTTEALASYRPARTVADQVAAGAPVSYGRYLAWRGLLPVEPPRRPEPARPSASASGRSTDWKFGLATAEGVLAEQP